MIQYGIRPLATSRLLSLGQDPLDLFLNGFFVSLSLWKVAP